MVTKTSRPTRTNWDRGSVSVVLFLVGMRQSDLKSCNLVPFVVVVDI